MSPFSGVKFELLSSPKTEDGESGEVDRNESSSSIPTIYNGHLAPSPLRGRIQTQLTGKPLKELSPLYRKKDTFVVIGRGSRILYRFGDASSFLTRSNGWRNQAITVLTHGIFNYFMVIVILLNCALIPTLPAKFTQNSTYSPEDEEGMEKDFHSIWNHFGNFAFVIIYIFEFGLKLIARGFKHGDSFACLKISWSWLDIFVIVTGVLQLAFPTNRTLLVSNGLRALKLIPLIPSWLSGYDRLFRKTWPRLLRALFFGIVLAIVSGLFSTDLFQHTLRNICVPTGEEFEQNNSSYEYFRSRPCGNYTLSEKCPANYTCIIGDKDPSPGDISFDTFFQSEYTLLNLFFQDFAEYVHEKIWAIHGIPTVIYGVILFFMVTFPVGVLVYAILGHEFEIGLADISAENEKELVTKEEGRDKPKSSSCWAFLQEHGRNVVQSEYFDVCITLVIIADLVLYCLSYYGSPNPEGLQTFLTNVHPHVILYSIYLAECILKLGCLGWREYTKHFWNRYDFFVAIVIFLSFTAVGVHPSVLTVLKIIPRWPTLNFLFIVMWRTIWITFRWAYGLNGILLFVFANTGYVYFGRNYIYSMELLQEFLPHWNMVSFWEAVRSVLRAFAGEWNESMWDLVLVSPESTKQAVTFMIVVAFSGNLLVKCLGIGALVTASQLLERDTLKAKRTSLHHILEPFAYVATKIMTKVFGNDAQPRKIENGSKIKKELNGIEVESADRKDGRESVQQQAACLLEKIMSHVIYCLFSSLLILILSFAALYSYFWAEIFFFLYFSIDFIARVALNGFDRSLIQAGFTFDLVMLINSLLALIRMEPFGLAYIGTFKFLMIVSRNPPLRAAVQDLWEQFQGLCSYLLATFFIWIAFALYGMNSYYLLFHKCHDEYDRIVSYKVIPGKAECIANNMSWANSQLNFDTTFNTLWTLFTVATRNGWLYPISDATDARTNDFNLQPYRNANPSAILYFFSFLLFGLLFPFYSMLSVMYNQYKTTQDSKSLSEEGAVKVKVEDEPPSSKGGSSLEKVVSHPYFEAWVIITIILDTIAHAVKVSSLSSNIHEYMYAFRVGILILYIVELTLRALRAKKSFFKSWIRVLLLLTCFISILELIMIELGANFIAFTLPRNLRLLHLLTIHKLWKWSFPEFRAFGSALSYTYSKLFSILTFYALLFCSFGTMGSMTFSYARDFKSWNPITSLFKIATISGIDGIYMRIGTECDYNGENCGRPVFAMYFIITFLGLTILCFAQMYLVLIFETIRQLRKTSNLKNNESLPKIEEQEMVIIEPDRN